MITIDSSRIAFSIGRFDIGWYGIAIAVAVMVLILWVTHEVRRKGGISYDTVVNAALIGIPSGIVFARLMHVIDQWDYYVQNPGQIIGGAGLSVWGAILGATLGVWLYSRVSKSFQFGYLADMLAPGIILAQAIGRVGCTLNGCCYGVPTGALFGIRYTNTDSFAALDIPFQPTQIYEIIYNLIVFAILLKLRGKLRPDGSLFLVYLSFYSVWRFGIDYIRVGTPFLFGLHQAQVISLAVLAVTLPLLILRTRPMKPQAAASLP
ncbi:MAG: prolipoprotein diacylglyceryl transferase [Dehalococcoidales bacterium]|nr:prolipoprotein diacylglyceryl transferase [Dehalococcoidales bacterium]